VRHCTRVVLYPMIHFLVHGEHDGANLSLYITLLISYIHFSECLLFVFPILTDLSVTATCRAVSSCNSNLT